MSLFYNIINYLSIKFFITVNITYNYLFNLWIILKNIQNVSNFHIYCMLSTRYICII